MDGVKNLDALDILIQLLQYSPRVLFVASTYLLLLHGFSEVVRPRFSRAKYGLYPWGFADREKEREYVEFFWLTAASNYKSSIFFVTCCAALADGYATAGLLLKGRWEYTDLPAYLCRNVISTTAAFLFSQRHLSHFTKKAFTFFHRRLAPFFPLFMLHQMCTAGSSCETNYLLQILISAVSPIFIQSWIWSVFQTLVIAWFPIIWSYFYIPDRDLVRWSCVSICISLLGPLFSAWRAMQRRKKWIRMRNKEDKRLPKLRTPLPAYSSSSFEDHGQSGQDRPCRSQSPSPARIVETDTGLRSRTWTCRAGPGPVCNLVGDGGLPVLDEDRHDAPVELMRPREASALLNLEKTLAHM